MTQELYQACRAWTIALFQHITENDYYILLIGSALADIDRGTSARRRLGNRRGADNEDKMRTREAVGSEVTGGQDQKQPVTVAALLEGSGALDDAFSQGTMGEFVPGQAERERTLVGEGSTGTASRPLPRQRQLYTLDDYREGVNPGADVFTLTAGAAALESTLPPIIRIVSEGYLSVDDDNIELIVAAEDIAGLFERNGVGNILRGAVLSPALAVDTYYTAAVSNLSPLFKLPVDAVQRGRDHGLPTYNDAREASSFWRDAECREAILKTFLGCKLEYSVAPALIDTLGWCQVPGGGNVSCDEWVAVFCARKNCGRCSNVYR